MKNIALFFLILFFIISCSSTEKSTKIFTKKEHFPTHTKWYSEKDQLEIPTACFDFLITSPFIAENKLLDSETNGDFNLKADVTNVIDSEGNAADYNTKFLGERLKIVGEITVNKTEEFYILQAQTMYLFMTKKHKSIVDEICEKKKQKGELNQSSNSEEEKQSLNDVKEYYEYIYSGTRNQIVLEILISKSFQPAAHYRGFSPLIAVIPSRIINNSRYDLEIGVNSNETVMLKWGKINIRARFGLDNPTLIQAGTTKKINLVVHFFTEGEVAQFVTSTHFSRLSLKALNKQKEENDLKPSDISDLKKMYSKMKNSGYSIFSNKKIILRGILKENK